MSAVSTFPTDTTIQSHTKLLIIQNEPTIPDSLQHRLNHAGFYVSAVATGATEALHHASQHPPDIAIIDLQLTSDLNGIETATEIWENFHIPILYLTDETDSVIWHDTMTIKPHGVLFKPLSESDLLETISNALLQYQRETELRADLAEREKQVELKSRLVSIVSHEFRNPLNAILFSTELLQRFGEDVTEEKRNTYFQRINGAVQRMNQLLDDVLMIGATDSGKISFNPHPIDLLSFIQDIIADFQPYNQDVVGFSCNTSVDPLVVVDEKLIRHIITNLISNAIKYSPQGTIIEFHITLDPSNAVFRIQDHGIGITPADQEKLFTAFHRGSNARRIPGTGLGLSIVKQCVDLHQGSITVQSEPGHGSTFTVTIPLNQAMQSGYDNHSGD